MEALIIQQTEFTPYISFDPESRKFKISGASRPEDVGDFYSAALDWLRRFETLNPASSFNKPIHMEFFMSYFNSSSAKIILQLLEVLKRMSEAGAELTIDWFYEEGDEQVREDGEELSYALDLPFNFQTR